MDDLAGVAWFLFVVTIARLAIKREFARADVRTDGSGTQLIFVITGIAVLLALAIYACFRIAGIAFLVRSLI